MADLDLDALTRLAEAATPGPWESGDGWVYTMPVYDDDLLLSNVLGMRFSDSEREATERARGRCNAEFIAAANPEVVLALIERVQAAEAKAQIDDEWEYGYPKGVSPTLTFPTQKAAERSTGVFVRGGAIRRRRKAGPWEPVPEGSVE